MSIDLKTTTLIEEANAEEKSDWQLPFNAISLNEEGVLVLGAPPPESKNKFQYRDLDVNIHIENTGDESTCHMWSPICRLPYSAEAPTARMSILRILRASRSLEGVKFVVEKDQRILAMYENSQTEPYTLDLLMMEVIYFLQKTSPFAGLLRARAPVK